MKALALYAGAAARQHIAQHGLQPAHIAAVAAAAGGPKGLMLLALDRFIFGDWLAQSAQTVHLVGASIGAWRLGAACLAQPVAGLHTLQQRYIHGDFTRKRINGKLHTPTPAEVSAAFVEHLQCVFGDEVPSVLAHPRYRLHVITSRGRHVLAREQQLRSVVGYAGAYLSNLASRRAMGYWLERVVFSAPIPVDAALHPVVAPRISPLPFAVDDYRTRQVLLTPDNFMRAVQASGSIPFVLQAVHDIAHAPGGAYWDGGITDYHLHLNWLKGNSGVLAGQDGQANIVLYPHFQQAVIPGWLDKALKWRHASTAALDHVLLLAPRPEWIRSLPNGKLPDRGDFKTYQFDHVERVRVWEQAVAASQQLADEWAQWLQQPDLSQVQPL